jgi:hypothetical protein
VIEVSGPITGARSPICPEGRAPASFFVDYACLASENLRYNPVLMGPIAWEFLQNSLGSRSVNFEMFFKTYGSLFQYNVLAWFAKRTAKLAH